MVLRQIQSTLCDFHLEDGAEVDADPDLHLRLTVNGAERELDLCAECWSQLRIVLEHALEVGTRPAINGNADKRNLGAARDFECPICHQWYVSRGSLSAHARTAHDVTGAEWAAVNPYAPKRKAPAVPADPCELCGYEAASAAGMSAHKRMRHPAPVAAPAKRRGRPPKAVAESAA